VIPCTSRPGAIRVLEVRTDGARDARVLDLHRDIAPARGARAVDLADRGGRDRLGVELGEGLIERLVVLGLDDLAHLLEGNLRRGVAQLGELALELLAILLGDQADVEERHHLPELHRRALHRPEHGDDLLGRLDLAARERRFGRLVTADEVDGARPELANRLPRGEPADRRRALDARSRDVLARHIARRR
jgi:hypothetical protein